MSEIVTIVTRDGEINFDHERLLRYSNAYKTLNEGGWLESHTKIIEVDFNLDEIEYAILLLSDHRNTVCKNVLDYLDKSLEFLDYLMLSQDGALHIARRIINREKSITFMFKYSGEESSLIGDIFDHLVEHDKKLKHNQWNLPEKRDNWKLYVRWLIQYYHSFDTLTFRNKGFIPSLDFTERERMEKIIPQNQLLQVYRDLDHMVNMNVEREKHIVRDIELKHYNYLLYMKTGVRTIEIRYESRLDSLFQLTLTNGQFYDFYHFYYSRGIETKIKTIWLHDENKNIIKEITLQPGESHFINPGDACYISLPTSDYVEYVNVSENKK